MWKTHHEEDFTLLSLLAHWDNEEMRQLTKQMGWIA